MASFLGSCATVWIFGSASFSGRWPWESGEAALWAAQLMAGVMGILLVHEAGHYVVARGHGIDRSPPYFIPMPFGFGTLGAVIALRSPPRSRTALLEMGAAGPLAGFVAVVVMMILGLPGTVEKTLAELGGSEAWELSLGETVVQLVANEPVVGLPVTVLSNPPLMDLLGRLMLGAPPSRWAELHPFALAAWLGCHLTAMNLFPAGSLDGGHVMAALWPRRARALSRAVIVALALGGLLWNGWFIWALLLWRTGAGRSVEVPAHSPLTRRAQAMALACLLAFLLCLMVRPTVAYWLLPLPA